MTTNIQEFNYHPSRVSTGKHVKDIFGCSFWVSNIYIGVGSQMMWMLLEITFAFGDHVFNHEEILDNFKFKLSKIDNLNVFSKLSNLERVQ